MASSFGSKVPCRAFDLGPVLGTEHDRQSGLERLDLRRRLV
jgi:hypothetical protein